MLRRLFIISGIAFSLLGLHSATAQVTSVRQVYGLTRQQFSQGVPVEIEAVVTYYDPAEHILFVNDGTGGIFIRTTQIFPFVPGDRIHVRGVTAASYHVVIASNTMQAVGKGALPTPVPATFAELIAGQHDCDFITIKGTVLAATLQRTVGDPFLLMEVRTDGGTISVHMQKPQGLDFHGLLDSQVSLTGVSGGRFDGKFQLVGSNIYLSSPAQMSVLQSAARDPETLALTPIDRIMSSYNVAERSERVRVQGSITLYEPGSQLVLEDESGKAILLHTHQSTPATLGEVVDATGFAYAHDYTLSMTHAQFSPLGKTQMIHPQPASWDDTLTGKYAMNLISLDGRLIEQVHGTSQDTLFINSGNHVFSAALRHAGSPSTRLASFPAGSYVRVSGVCFVEAGGPWRAPLSFELHLRSSNDVQVLAHAPWWTVTHLEYVIGALVLLTLGFLIWVETLRQRVHEQTHIIRQRMEEEAARERRQAFLDRERGRLLEAINSQMPLNEVLRLVARFVSERMEGLECWCNLYGDDACRSEEQTEDRFRESAWARHCTRDILSSKGEKLGELILAWNTNEEQLSIRPEVLEMGVRVAALAIENRRLYETLVRRSHYDQLTGVPNRFLLESRLKEVFESARSDEQSFALIYIDLDRFKSINDRYGHRIGDLYLQSVAQRLSEKLRAQDILARVGGDEFIALIPAVQGRSEAEDIARRLVACFELPFRIDGRTMEGSASIGVALYPEDGIDEDQLKRVADSAMYASKQRVVDWE